MMTFPGVPFRPPISPPASPPTAPRTPPRRPSRPQLCRLSRSQLCLRPGCRPGCRPPTPRPSRRARPVPPPVEYTPRRRPREGAAAVSRQPCQLCLILCQLCPLFGSAPVVSVSFSRRPRPRPKTAKPHTPGTALLAVSASSVVAAASRAPISLMTAHSWRRSRDAMQRGCATQSHRGHATRAPAPRTPSPPHAAHLLRDANAPEMDGISEMESPSMVTTRLSSSLSSNRRDLSRR